MKNSLLAIAFVSLASSVSWSYDYYSSYSSSNYNDWQCWGNELWYACDVIWYQKDCNQIEGDLPTRLNKIDGMVKKISYAYELIENKPASGNNYYTKQSMLIQLKEKGNSCFAIRAEILSTMTRRFR